MIVETQLTFDNYVKLVFALTYRKGIIIVIHAVGLLGFLTGLFYFAGVRMPGDEPPYTQFVFGVILLFGFPFLIYRNAKKNYASSGRITERITYEFTEDKILIRGDSFSSEQDWAKLYQVKEIKNWVLLYQNRQIAHPIPKAAFGDRIVEFRELARRKNSKAKLM